MADERASLWSRWPVTLRAVISGLLVALVAANVWPLLVLNLGAAAGAAIEVLFLSGYVWWASGAGPPKSTRAARRAAFRGPRLAPRQWVWGLIVAVSFAVSVHACIVVLFRLVPFPAADFHKGYDFSFIPTLPLRWLAVVMSAASAGICEEIGFRGYMQQPIERRHGPVLAILVSSALFTLLHLNKGWSTAPMVPIVFIAGVLLGLIAWASGSLVPTMIGHTLMDIGLFGYWWTGIAGEFTARPIGETGVDQPFEAACAVAATSLGITLIAVWRLRRFRPAAA
jgi:membrane protease YdiL (CAAX protease family)